MENIIYKFITYRDLSKGDILNGYSDKYAIGSFINDNIKKCFLSSPTVDLDKKAVLLAINNGEIVGRHLFYHNKIRINHKIIDGFSTGSTEVHYTQRGKGIGSMINKLTLENMEFPIYLFSLVTPDYIRILSKKENNCIIFNFPQLIKINNVKCAFECRGISGKMLQVCTSIGNHLLSLINMRNRYKFKHLQRLYRIEKLDIVPMWAGEMCNDNHKYSEFHNQSWLQWNLTNNLSGLPEDKQSFYAIYKNSKPVGFFFTKERLRTDIKKCKNMICGTICEWASIDSQLSEIDINLIATTTFSKECYHILTVCDTDKTAKLLKKIGFIKYGHMQMGFQDKGLKNLYPDIDDISQWRIRYGCCNSILY